MKVVINKCFGGFGLSPLAIKRYCELNGKTAFFYAQTKYSHKDGKDEYKRIHDVNSLKDVFSFFTYSKDLGEIFENHPRSEKDYFYANDLDRNDPFLVQVVEELGDLANDRYANLRVMEIPDDIQWEIDDYDGMESIHEQHRSW